jgi:uncharacterized protein involved in oxidation of intracellular sulfur
MPTKKLGLIVTHAADDPEMATLPFMLATAAIAMDVEPVVVFQSEGVRLAVAGGAEAAAAEGLAPVADLMAAVLEAGYTIMCCASCLKTRGIGEADLIEGCEVGGAAGVVEAMLECDSSLRY